MKKQNQKLQFVHPISTVVYLVHFIGVEDMLYGK